VKCSWEFCMCCQRHFTTISTSCCCVALWIELLFRLTKSAKNPSISCKWSINQSLIHNNTLCKIWRKQSAQLEQLEIRNELPNKPSCLPFVFKLYLQFVGCNLAFDGHPEIRSVFKLQAFLSQFNEYFQGVLVKFRQRRTSIEGGIFFLWCVDRLLGKLIKL